MKTFKDYFYNMGKGTKWESFEDFLVRYALKKYDLTITVDFASQFNSVAEFDDYVLKNGGDI